MTLKWLVTSAPIEVFVLLMCVCASVSYHCSVTDFVLPKQIDSLTDGKDLFSRCIVSCAWIIRSENRDWHTSVSYEDYIVYTGVLTQERIKGAIFAKFPTLGKFSDCGSSVIGTVFQGETYSPKYFQRIIYIIFWNRFSQGVTKNDGLSHRFEGVVGIVSLCC